MHVEAAQERLYIERPLVIDMVYVCS